MILCLVQASRGPLYALIWQSLGDSPLRAKIALHCSPSYRGRRKATLITFVLAKTAISSRGMQTENLTKKLSADLSKKRLKEHIHTHEGKKVT